VDNNVELKDVSNSSDDDWNSSPPEKVFKPSATSGCGNELESSIEKRDFDEENSDPWIFKCTPSPDRKDGNHSQSQSQSSSDDFISA